VKMPRKQVPGKECREKLYVSAQKPKRWVPAFTYQALQKNTRVIPPQKINIYKSRWQKQTLFYTFNKRGDIPAVRTGAYKGGNKNFPVRWNCNVDDMDYCYFLPIFIDGLADKDNELRLFAQYGAMDLIARNPHKVLPVLPKLILPFKRAFFTRNKKVIIAALTVIQHMVSLGPCVGIALVPYYRQLLFACNLYKNANVNLGEGVDRYKRISDVIEETLNMMERCGGPNAFINIKYMVPTYESAVQPRCDPHDM